MRIIQYASTKEFIRQEGRLPLTAYVISNCVLPPSGQTDKLLPAEALTDYTVQREWLYTDTSELIR